MKNAGVDNKKTKDNYLFSLSVNVVYSGAFTGTVIQLLLFAKHRVGVIVTSHRPMYRQTAAMHNKFSRKFTTLVTYCTLVSNTETRQSYTSLFTFCDAQS